MIEGKEHRNRSRSCLSAFSLETKSSTHLRPHNIHKQRGIHGVWNIVDFLPRLPIVPPRLSLRLACYFYRSLLSYTHISPLLSRPSLHLRSSPEETASVDPSSSHPHPWTSRQASQRAGKQVLSRLPLPSLTPPRSVHVPSSRPYSPVGRYASVTIPILASSLSFFHHLLDL